MAEFTEADISFRSNSLLVRGRGLEMDNVTPEELYTILNMGRTALAEHIETIYTQTVEKNPGGTIVRPSLGIVQLSPNGEKMPVVSGYGKLNDTNIYRHVIEVTPGKPRELWAAVEEAEFTPEARLFSRGRDQDTVSLLVRNPETDPAPLTPIDHLPAALGFVDPAITDDLLPQMQSAFARGGESDGEYLALRREYFDASEAKIDDREAIYGPVNRGMAQIGYMIASQLLRFRVEGVSPSARYVATLRVALEYAYQQRAGDAFIVLDNELQRVAPLWKQKTTP